MDVKRGVETMEKGVGVDENLEGLEGHQNEERPNTKEQLLELELKALKMEYDSAKDRWYREREAHLKEISELQVAIHEADDRGLGGRNESQFQKEDTEVCNAMRRNSAGGAGGGGGSSRPGSFDGATKEIRILKNEYHSAQMRWDKVSNFCHQMIFVSTELCENRTL